MNGVPLSGLTGMMTAGYEFRLAWSVIMAVAWTLRGSIRLGAIDAGTEDKPAKW